jgi:hypothetical protein
VRQRLVAILAADVAGYSRLMSLDDQATVRALDVARDVFRDRIAEHDGRVVDMAGDSVLAIFDTAVGALRAALGSRTDWRRSLRACRGRSPMRFRIGVHLGDVIEKDDGSVYGDGVNTPPAWKGWPSQAASRVAGDRVGDPPPAEVRFVDIGAQQVKNIAQRCAAFRCVPLDVSALAPGRFARRRPCRRPRGAAGRAAAVRAAFHRRSRRRRVLLGIAVTAAMVLVGWRVLPKLIPHAPPAAYSADDRRMTFAVRPFSRLRTTRPGRRSRPRCGGRDRVPGEEHQLGAGGVAGIGGGGGEEACHPRPSAATRVHFLLRGVVVADPPGYKVELAVVDTRPDRVSNRSRWRFHPARCCQSARPSSA